jgi:squalene synthase HpnC
VTTPFADELKCWGPEGTSTGPVSLAEAQRYCRRLATTHYENFPVVSWLLPRRLHQPFFNVYAYCRWADDLADEVGDRSRALELLSWWRSELDRCYSGHCEHPVFVALAETIRQFHIPPQPFEDLISAFEQDQRVVEYETFADLLDYCRRSANPVGRLVLHLCGCPTAKNFEWSDAICTGLQLANFWQDVARDLDIGRVYLPREDRARFGYSEADLHHRTTTPEFLALMEFEVGRTREWLEAWRRIGPRPVSGLPARLHIEIELFARGGLRILDRIESIGYRVWDTRPVLTRFDFARLLSGTLCGALLGRWHARRDNR